MENKTIDISLHSLPLQIETENISVELLAELSDDKARVEVTKKKETNIRRIIAVNGKRQRFYTLKQKKEEITSNDKEIKRRTRNCRHDVLLHLLNALIVDGKRKVNNDYVIYNEKTFRSISEISKSTGMTIKEIKSAIFNFNKLGITTDVYEISGISANDEIDDNLAATAKVSLKAIKIPEFGISKKNARIKLNEIDDADEDDYNPVIKHLFDIDKSLFENSVCVSEKEKSILLDIKRQIDQVELNRKNGESTGDVIVDSLGKARDLVYGEYPNASDFFIRYIAYRKVTLSIYLGQCLSFNNVNKYADRLRKSDSEELPDFYDNGYNAATSFLRNMGQANVSINNDEFVKWFKNWKFDTSEYGKDYSESMEWYPRILNDIAFMSWGRIDDNKNDLQQNYLLAKRSFWCMNLALKYKRVTFDSDGNPVGFNIDVSLRNVADYLLKVLDYFNDQSDLKEKLTKVDIEKYYETAEKILKLSTEINAKGTRNIKNYIDQYELYDKWINLLLDNPHKHEIPEGIDGSSMFNSLLVKYKEKDEGTLKRINELNEKIGSLGDEYNIYFEKGLKDSYIRERIHATYFRNKKLLIKVGFYGDSGKNEIGLLEHINNYRFLLFNYYRDDSDMIVKEFKYLESSSGYDLGRKWKSCTNDDCKKAIDSDSIYCKYCGEKC